MSVEFDVFFRQSYPEVVRVLAAALGSSRSAEDAAQHGYLKALGRWRRVRVMSNPVGWVYVVALRHARKLNVSDLAEQLDENSLCGTDQYVQAIHRASLREALAELTPRQRSVFLLRHAAGLTGQEVGEALGIKASTVRATDHQARQRLRAVLEPLAESRTEHADAD